MTTLAKISSPNGQNVSSRNYRRPLPSFSSWFDDLFETGLGSSFLSNAHTGATLPAANIKETKDEYLLEIAVPGMKKSDFNIDLDHRTLSIASEKSEEHIDNQETYTRREFGYTSFKRTFTLPDTVESGGINATYEDGILSVHFPKKEEAKVLPTKRIDVL